MKSKINYFLLSFLLITIFSSCRKDLTEPKATEASIESIAVPESFDWKTTKEYSLNLTSTSSGLLEISNLEGIAYLRLFLSAGNPYSGKLTLPSYETKVSLKFQGYSTEIELTSQNISYQFN
jgi:hypothetical protein